MRKTRMMAGASKIGLICHQIANVWSLLDRHFAVSNWTINVYNTMAEPKSCKKWHMTGQSMVTLFYPVQAYSEQVDQLWGRLEIYFLRNGIWHCIKNALWNSCQSSYTSNDKVKNGSSVLEKRAFPKGLQTRQETEDKLTSCRSKVERKVEIPQEWVTDM